MPTYSCSSSPFSHVLDTNYAPSEEEYANIRSLLYEPEQRAVNLAQEIQKLQAELDEVQHFIDRHRSLLSPVRRVPADLLGEIFVEALPSNTFDLAARTVKDAPLLLTTICHSWREVALKTPRLWNRIHIYLPRHHPEFPDDIDQLSFLIQRRKQGVEMWLERSGALPVTFSISVGSDWGARPFGSESLESDYFANFAALLTKYSRRLGAVKIDSERQGGSDPFDSGVWQSFAELTREDLPILQDVQLAGQLFTYAYSPQGDLLTTPTPTPLALLLPKLSSLRTLHLSEESVEDVLSLGLRWTFVTHLTLKSRLGDSTHASVVVTMVKSCPSLLSLSLDTTLVHFPGPEISDSTVLSSVPPQRTSIQSLTLRLQVRNGLRADLSRALLATFQGISTPALEDLTIVTESSMSRRHSDMVSNSHVGSHMPFHETLARSNCRITHLTINGFLLANLEALSRSFELLESLISFTCEGDPYNGNSYNPNQSDSDYLTPFLRLLAENTSLCPRLERIQMDCEVRHIDAIITFTSSRHRLKHLAADFGLLVAKGDSEDVSSEIVKAVVAEWRQARGIQVVWKWQNTLINPGLLDHPWKGIPGARPDDCSALWTYTPPQSGYL
ncbi:hypothetical protein V5O48_017259 [Marasmius crinis-equi]|uniref:F-box domain-containing protein n=1 Tax=Marasmius crinis-equi TaxID=585013 RepID=A0ABR3EPH4_9AGAR